MDERNPTKSHHEVKPWLKPERLLGFKEESNHSVGFLWQCEVDFVHAQYLWRGCSSPCDMLRFGSQLHRTGATFRDIAPKSSGPVWTPSQVSSCFNFEIRFLRIFTSYFFAVFWFLCFFPRKKTNPLGACQAFQWSAFSPSSTSGRQAGTPKTTSPPPPAFGCGSKLNRQGTAGFGPCFHLYTRIPFWVHILDQQPHQHF